MTPATLDILAALDALSIEEVRAVITTVQERDVDPMADRISRMVYARVRDAQQVNVSCREGGGCTITIELDGGAQAA